MSEYAGKKIVVALGGNAILSGDASAVSQQKAISETVIKLVSLMEEGCQLVVSHGNGPQVGNLLLQQLSANSEKNPAMPLDTLVAMTQGSIGYWMVKSFEQRLREKQLSKEVVALMTEVVVDEHDPAFANPTKPIGPFYSKEEAELEMAKESTVVFKEDSGRGWRKVVPSPAPQKVKGSQIVKQLVESGVLVVAAGGGGIPIIEKGVETIGVEAVIDKDFAAEKLGELIDADLFIILTGVDNVFVNYNQPNQTKLENVSVEQLRGYIKEEQFASGSMLPKIEAAIKFVESGIGRKTIITSLEKLGMITSGAGTVVTS